MFAKPFHMLITVSFFLPPTSFLQMPDPHVHLHIHFWAYQFLKTQCLQTELRTVISRLVSPLFLFALVNGSIHPIASEETAPSLPPISITSPVPQALLISYSPVKIILPYFWVSANVWGLHTNSLFVWERLFCNLLYFMTHFSFF